MDFKTTAMKNFQKKINGLNLNGYTWGDSSDPLLLCVHGWLDTGAGFHWLAEELLKQSPQKYFIIAPDLRGYGHSQHSPNALGYFFFEYVADLKALAEAFSPKQPFRLLGHSLGGAIASVFAGAYPQRLSHLINLEGFGFQRSDRINAPERAKDWIEAFPPKPFPIHKDWQALAKRLQGSNPRLNDERAEFLAKHLGEAADGGVRMAADPAHKIHEPYTVPIEVFYQFWQAVSAKSLFIAAAETEMKQYFGEDQFEAVMAERAKHFPKNCQSQTLKAAGHMMHHEKPKTLAKKLSHFLKE